MGKVESCGLRRQRCQPPSLESFRLRPAERNTVVTRWRAKGFGCLPQGFLCSGGESQRRQFLNSESMNIQHRTPNIQGRSGDFRLPIALSRNFTAEAGFLAIEPPKTVGQYETE